ncbi:cytochrome P450 [Hypomontagnella monticulosa]|nr:cytochrome P450 [Hypomontagnella monticulosa]
MVSIQMNLSTESQTASWAIFALFLGPLSHHFYFIKGEHHLKAPFYFRTLLILAALCSIPLTKEALSTKLGLHWPFIILLSYLASLFSSITIYRLYLHPIRHYPGPKLAAVSKLWHSWLTRTSQNHRVINVWYEKYGEFIRTGPNEITVIHAEALEALHGPRSTCSKSDWYDILKPHVAVNTTRDKKEHEMRRKSWNPSFSKEAIPNYDAAYQRHNHHFEALIRQHLLQDINILDIIYRWSFDVMGEVTFSKSFETLTHSHSRHHLETLRRFLGFLGPCSPAPWLIIIGASIPGVMSGWNRMFDTCKRYILERMEMKSNKPDIASTFAASFQDQQPTDTLSGDAVSMVVAGSDTLASTLVYALFHLAKSPQYQEMLLSELRQQNILCSTAPGASNLQSLPFLNALISETLRLHNPVPTGTPRITGPEGLTIAGRYIPPFTTVVAPRYHIARLPYCFHNPNEFDPTRWLNHKDKHIAHDTRAFSPFSLGRYGCIGRELALRQARVFLTVMMSKFRVELAEGEDGVAVERDMRDEFTALPGNLWVRFSERERCE